MREWLSGRASPCQGERREFESRLPLQKRNKFGLFFFFVHFFKENISELLIMSRKRGIMELSYIISIKSIYYRKYKCCGPVSFLSLQKTKAV